MQFVLALIGSMITAAISFRLAANAASNRSMEFHSQITRLLDPPSSMPRDSPTACGADSSPAAASGGWTDQLTLSSHPW